MYIEHIFKEPKKQKYKTPVLFVHGAWHGAWCWNQGYLDFFADHGFSAHALSLRGHGASDGRAAIRGTRLKHYVEDIAVVADKFSSEPIIVGHSMGGMVVQKYLESHPARAGILMASAPPSGILSTALRTHLQYPIQALKMHFKLSLYPLVETKELARKLFFSESMTDEKLKNYADQLQDESYMAFLDMVMLSLPKPALVNVPIMVMGAENDAVFTPSQITLTAEAYHTSAIMFPEMAHDMMLEKGWENVADKMIAWMTDVGTKQCAVPVA